MIQPNKETRFHYTHFVDTSSPASDLYLGKPFVFLRPDHTCFTLSVVLRMQKLRNPLVGAQGYQSFPLVKLRVSSEDGVRLPTWRGH